MFACDTEPVVNDNHEISASMQAADLVNRIISAKYADNVRTKVQQLWTHSTCKFTLMHFAYSLHTQSWILTEKPSTDATDKQTKPEAVNAPTAVVPQQTYL